MKNRPLLRSTTIEFFGNGSGAPRAASAALSPVGGFLIRLSSEISLCAGIGYRNASKDRRPAFAKCVDATMATDDQAARKAVFAKLQKFAVERHRRCLSPLLLR
jgi:hypothetical protein